MAKIRKTGSIENGIMQVLKTLSEKEVQETIGKSSSYLRKCSDPSQQQQLDHNEFDRALYTHYDVQLARECVGGAPLKRVRFIPAADVS